MQDCRRSDLYTILGFKDAPRFLDMRDSYDVKRCDLSSHRDLHDLLTHVSGTKSPRQVEIAILYDKDIEHQSPLYRYPLDRFYDFIYDMGHRSTVH